jgi:hypothetical protein
MDKGTGRKGIDMDTSTGRQGIDMETDTGTGRQGIDTDIDTGTGRQGIDMDTGTGRQGIDMDTGTGKEWSHARSIYVTMKVIFKSFCNACLRRNVACSETAALLNTVLLQPATRESHPKGLTTQLNLPSVFL